MAIVKLPNGIYQVRLKVNGRVQGWSISRIKKDARDFQSKKQTEIRENKFFDKEYKCELLFKDLAKIYVEKHQDKKSITRDYSSLIHLNKAFGDILARDITADMLDSYQRDRKKLGRAIATVNLELTCMSAIYTWAIKKARLLKENPVHFITKEKPNNERDRIISEDEFNRLLGVAPDYFKAILLMAWHTAMREREILKLIWDRVDMSIGFIHLLAHETKEKKKKDIPINNILSPLFNKLENQRSKDTDRVFLRDGKPIKDIRGIFMSCCEKVGIEDFHFHDLRHCAITRWVNDNQPILTIMKITGHNSLQSFKRYFNPEYTALKAVVNSPIKSLVHEMVHTDVSQNNAKV